MGAIADYDEAIRLKPDYAEAYNNRGTEKGALGQRDEAIADYDDSNSVETRPWWKPTTIEVLRRGR